uniref:Uncharacterized protein n=1 Tax=Mycena chlorophos TaxID=658473 RepID=A0ABQ0LB51_MYCCL|nr:predicted protein [Mycena chlorophos]
MSSDTFSPPNPFGTSTGPAFRPPPTFSFTQPITPFTEPTPHTGTIHEQRTGQSRGGQSSSVPAVKIARPKEYDFFLLPFQLGEHRYGDELVFEAYKFKTVDDFPLLKKRLDEHHLYLHITTSAMSGGDLLTDLESRIAAHLQAHHIHIPMGPFDHGTSSARDRCRRLTIAPSLPP